MATKDKKSFKKYAKKHLATVIENRRKTVKAKKEKIERVEKKKLREAKEAQREEREHQEQLERLKDTDPEFYSYLEEEDPTLLQFGEDMEVVNDDEGSDAETEVDDENESHNDDEEKEGGSNSEKNAKDSSASRITREEVERLVKGKNIEACIDIFASAVRELGYTVRENPKTSSVRKFDDPLLVKESMFRIARFIGSNLSHFITGKGSFKSHKTRFLMRRLLLFLVTSVSEGGSVDAVLTAGLLHALTPFVPILHYIKGITKSVLKAALLLCSAPEESVRIAAYVVVRAVATRATGTRSMYQSTAFKGIFLTLVKTAHHYNIHNASLIAFLINCVVDLYGTDMEAAYQHTFVYLRQLAIYLRSALQQQTQSNVRAVVNWQYLNALRTWGAVLSKYSEASQMGPLIHPMVQISVGLMDLFASPRMFPMHLQIIEILNHISLRADGVFIPVAPYLLRILTSPSIALNRNYQGQGEKGEQVDLQFTIRVKKSQMRSVSYHLHVWSECIYLLSEHLATHSHTLGFPEAFWVVETTLKQLRSEVKIPKVHAQLSTLLRHIQTTSQRIIARRDQVSIGPCDLAAVKQVEDELKAAGNPLSTYHQMLRQQRVELFAMKQKNVNGGERTTLEAIVNGRREKKSRKRTLSNIDA
ncbi:nucleolar complex protein 2 [Trypanosoma rangeli]|uniref:Nucleolar complex protein 2 n=1 Tax=Trypanosoma rangeli TaxID=5698 RepID=A0A3R7MKH6_TRYRA|nr:nucleolar complex protein 2 [Trypanosoma rangeli]RNF07454.1 nucleolar complex protein 2 [Trypanosoma rangeli]|eukprot:RNF07454.1 nucleolar complex protein 2 [Trypanosoma rangeli]